MEKPAVLGSQDSKLKRSSSMDSDHDLLEAACFALGPPSVLVLENEGVEFFGQKALRLCLPEVVASGTEVEPLALFDPVGTDQILGHCQDYSESFGGTVSLQSESTESQTDV